jgi:hypothetical protein
MRRIDATSAKSPGSGSMTASGKLVAAGILMVENFQQQVES